MKNRILALMLAGVTMASLLAGCGSKAVDEAKTGTQVATDEKKAGTEKENTERKTVVIGQSSFDSATREIWPTDFVKQMEDDLNINIEFKKVTNEQKDLFLASGEAFVDIVGTPAGKEQQVIQAGAAVALDPYLEEYGQNILGWEDRNNLVRELLSNGTGELYFKRVQVGPESPKAPTKIWNGYVVRWDLYKEMGAPAINSDDDYIAILEEMVKNNPVTENGDKTYGMGIDNDGKLWSWISQFEASDAMMGIVPGAQLSLSEDQLINRYTDDRASFWRSMEFFNKLYNKGLLDPDSFTMTGETRKERAAKGIYIGGARTWDVGRYYKVQSKENPNTLKGHMPIFPEQGGMSAWYGANPVAGWEYNSLYIPSSSENIVEAVKVLDYMDNLDNLRRYYSGEKGVHWEVDASGKPVPTKFGLDLKAKGGDEWEKTGIKHHYDFMAGASGWFQHPDGGYLNLFQNDELKYAGLSHLNKDYADFYGVQYPGEVHYKQVEQGITIDRRKEQKDLFMVLGVIPSDMSRTASKLDDLLVSYIPLLVSVSPEDFENEKAKAKEQLSKAGADKLFSWAEGYYQEATDKLQAAKDKYGIK